MAHLSCDETTARDIMNECRSRNGIKGYGAIEKHLILDFIEEKQRQQREREDRHKADIAIAESVAVLKEQVNTLREQVNTLRDMCASSSEDARKARAQSLAANFISAFSAAVAITALVLKIISR